MSIMNGMLALVMLVFAALYKELAPRTRGDEKIHSAAIIKSKDAKRKVCILCQVFSIICLAVLIS